MSKQQMPFVLPEEPPFQVSEYTNSRTYNIYLSQDIQEPEKYVKLFDLFRNVGRHDIINLYINSPGGNLATGVQLINAMRETSAYVVTYLDGMAYSLAPILFLCGDEFITGDHTMMMFHDYSTVSGGKGSEIHANSSATQEFYKTLLDKYVFPFLTKEEIIDITDGKDLYLNTDQVNERLDVVREHRNNEDIDEEAEGYFEFEVDDDDPVKGEEVEGIHREEILSKIEEELDEELLDNDEEH